MVEDSLIDRLGDCEMAAKDTADLCKAIKKSLIKLKVMAVEIERQLSLTDVDLEDHYNPIVRALRVVEELIYETD